MKLSIVIVNYNVCFFLEQCLRSVKSSISGLDAEVLIVDNNSVDGSVEMVKEKFSEFILIESGSNLGFSKANNLALRKTKGEFVLLLNPDTLVEEDTLVKCCAFMEAHPEAGGLGVYMVDGAGAFLPESKRGLPTPIVAFYKIFGLASLFPKSEKFGKYHLGYLDKNLTHEVEVLSGAFLMTRKQTLEKVGLLDEEYFMYGEDIDLSYRITQGGYKNFYYPEAKIIHYKGESTKKTSINYVFVFYNAMIIFAKKHFSTKNAKLFTFLIYIAIYLKASVDISINFIKNTFQTLLDAGLIFLGLYVFKNYWESNYKPVSVDYPPEFIGVAVPLYIITWLITNHLSGGNDKPIDLWKILRGALVGTLLISAASNFFDEYRFSKVIIVIGGSISFFELTISRWITHYVQNKTWILSKAKPKKVAIVGDDAEVKRVFELLADIKANVEVIGFVSITQSVEHIKKHLGNISKISEVVIIHDIEELIFCSKDVSANKIIELMVALNTAVEYKIVPDKSDYIIGSNSKNTQGALYTIDIKLNISSKSNIRNKRLFDVFFSLVYFFLSPFFILFVDKRLKSIGNSFDVLFGKKTWVGYLNQYDIKLPKIKPGIISPSSAAKPINDYQYAKEYTIFLDIKLVVSNFSKLGS